MQNRFQHRDQELFADFGSAPDHLPLRQRIHGVDVIHPFLAFPSSLVHRIYSQVARFAPWVGPPPLADRNWTRPRRLVYPRHSPVSRAAPYVVQMRYRDLRQATEFPVAEFAMRSPQNASRRRPAQPLVRAVHLRQQRDVVGSVLDSETLPPIDSCFHFPGLRMRSNQSRDLRHAQPGDLAQVRSNRSFFLLSPLLIFLADEHLLDPAVNFRSALPAEFDPRTALQELVDLRICKILGVPHSDVHSPADCLPCSSHFQDHLVLESSSASGSSCIG